MVADSAVIDNWEAPYAPPKCSHGKHELRHNVLQSKLVLYGYQCLACGMPVGGWLKHHNSPTVPAWDQEIQRRWQTRPEKWAAEVTKRAVADAYEATRFRCQCLRHELRCKTCRNGQLRRMSQCIDCGHQVHVPIPRGTVAANLPPWDDTLAHDWFVGNHHRNDDWRLARRSEMRQAHVADYRTYLTSDAWKAKRAQVVARDGGKCRGCGGRGSDAHHLTYERLFVERLEDLILLCRSCHESTHEIGEASR